MDKSRIVRIPNATEEVRIGYSFNYLIRVIAETEAADAVLWDFADVTFLHPFFLAPLAIYKNTSGKDIKCINISLRIQAYLNSICFDRMLYFDHEKREDVDAVMQKYTNKTYLPLCSFAMTNANKDAFGSIMKAILMKPKVDTKGDDKIVSRIGAKRRVDYLIEPKIFKCGNNLFFWTIL